MSNGIHGGAGAGGFPPSEIIGGVPVVQVAVVEERKLTIHNVTTEQKDGMYLVHLDVLWSPQAALRYTLPFDRAGLDRFMNKLAAAGTGLEIAE